MHTRLRQQVPLTSVFRAANGTSPAQRWSAPSPAQCTRRAGGRKTPLCNAIVLVFASWVCSGLAECEQQPARRLSAIFISKQDLWGAGTTRPRGEKPSQPTAGPHAEYSLQKPVILAAISRNSIHLPKCSNAQTLPPPFLQSCEYGSALGLRPGGRTMG